MDSTDKQIKEDYNNIIILRKEWDYSPHIEKEEITSYHITRKRENQLLVDFLIRKEEGALLICGKRGIGKTSAVFSAIHSAKNLFEIDPVLKKIELLEGTGADVYIPFRMEFYIDWMLREIDCKVSVA